MGDPHIWNEPRTHASSEGGACFTFANIIDFISRTGKMELRKRNGK